MNLFSIFKRSNTIKPVVIFDIGSASIGGAVVFFDKKVPHITYCTRMQLPFQEVADTKRLLPQIEEFLGQIAKDIQKNGLQRTKGDSLIPQEIVCVLSSLWTHTQTTCASFEHKKHFEVTDRIMDNLFSQIRKTNKANDKRGRKHMEVIEEVIISSVLNGYPTQFPLGKEASRIEVTYLESTVTKKLHRGIRNAVLGVFSPDIPLLFRSFTLVSFCVARDIFENIKDFLLIDVTGEITELTVVRDSILEDTISFPYGRNTLIRDIAKKTGSVPEDVLARIKIAFSSTKDISKMKDVIFEEEKRWTEMFGEACGEISSEMNPLPQRVFLVADTDYADWFHKMIERVDFSQFTATREAFQVSSLIGEHMENVCVLRDGVTKDNFLIIDSLLYNRECLSRAS